MSANTKGTITECVNNKQRSCQLLKLGYSQDSGYETDLSTSLLETSISDSDVRLKDLPTDRKGDCIVNDNEGDYMLDTSIDCDSESETDREVAELLGHSLKIRNTHRLSCEIHEQRPSAPLPEAALCRDGIENKTKCKRIKAEKPGFDILTNKMCRHDKSLTVCKLCSSYYFRPVERSDTTTGRGSYIAGSSAFAASSDANQSALSRVTNVNPITRQRSEYAESSGALPDLIPIETERSRSLPDIVALRQHHENEMGRELRRIGDEFETTFRERNARKVQTVSWSVFNCSLTLHLSGYLNTIRRVLSPEPSHTHENR